MITSIPPNAVDDYEFDAHGFVVHRGLIPHSDIDRYVEFWHANLGFDPNPRYSPEFTELRYLYTDMPEVRDLLCHPQVRWAFEQLDLGDLAVHSDILAWNHAGIPFHCDVLNESEIPHCGVWIALDDIPVEAGRFQIYAESHRWDKHLPDCGLTPTSTESPYHVQELIAGTLMEPVTFDARKGDILIWNTHCLHGAEKQQDGFPRKIAIAHVGEVPRVEGKQNKVRHNDGMWYVP